jgi:hypothetical protein
MESTWFQGGSMEAERIHPTTGTTAHILSIGDDAWLLSSRQMVLESSGYEVHSFSSDELIEDEITLQCDLLQCNLAILCHSIEPERAEELANRLRRLKPSLPLLVLTCFESCSIHGLEGSVSSSNPGVFLEMVLQMMNIATSSPAPDGTAPEVPRGCTGTPELRNLDALEFSIAPRRQNVYENFRAASLDKKRRE